MATVVAPAGPLIAGQAAGFHLRVALTAEPGKASMSAQRRAPGADLAQEPRRQRRRAWTLADVLGDADVLTLAEKEHSDPGMARVAVRDMPALYDAGVRTFVFPVRVTCRHFRRTHPYCALLGRRELTPPNDTTGRPEALRRT